MTLVEKTFYFLCHGPTAWNDMSLCQGQRDVPLSKEGETMAFNFAENLLSKEVPFSGIIASPLQRALCTAEIIGRSLPLLPPISILEELQERGFGDLEGISSEQMYLIEKKEEEDSSFIPGHGVELRATCRERIKRGVEKSLELYSAPPLVSHGRVFLSLCECLGLPSIRQIPNLSLFKFTLDGGLWKVRKMED